MSGVLLVSAIKRALQFKTNNLNEAVQSASLEQLRALLTILVVAIVGLVPAATSSGIGSDVQRPLATVIIGGLSFTMLCAPIIIPPLYLWMAQYRQKSSAKKKSPENLI